MAYYKLLKSYKPEKADWIAKRLKDLRTTIRASELGKREPESYYRIVEYPGF